MGSASSEKEAVRDGEIQLMYEIARCGILRQEKVWTSLNVLLSGQVLCRASTSKLGSGGRREDCFLKNLGRANFVNQKISG